MNYTIKTTDDTAGTAFDYMSNLPLPAFHSARNFICAPALGLYFWYSQ